MKKFSCLSVLVLFLLFSTSARAAEQSFEGVSRPIYNAQLSFSVPGTIYKIAVKRGQEVKKGELLMHLDDRAENSRLAQLDYELKNTIKIRTLTARIKQAKLDMERFRAALRKKAATLMEFQHAELGHSLSILALEEEKFRLEQLKHSREELSAHKDKMYLYAPFDGFVEEIAVELGMAVDRNVPAIRFVAIDPLLVELTLPVDKAQNLKVGDKAEVRRQGFNEIMHGEVMQVAKIAVLSNKTLKVRVTVENPTALPAGLMLNVSFPKLAEQ